MHKRRFRKDIEIFYGEVIFIKYTNPVLGYGSSVRIDYTKDGISQSTKFSDGNEILDYVNISAPKFLTEKGINYEWYS